MKHLRSWTDVEGWQWTDVCSDDCDAGEDHWVEHPTHEVTWPELDGEQWASRLCQCYIGRDHGPEAWAVQSA